VTAGHRTPGKAGIAIRGVRAEQSKPNRRTPATPQRTVASLTRVEAFLLARNILVLAGLLAGGAIVWYEIYHSGQPLWWNTAWQIGYGQLLLAMAVLIGAHLATGRARRDGMADLYASFPTSAGTRTISHLTALAGTALPSLILVGAATATAELSGAAGSPSVATLATGLLLVIAAGAVGVAIATRFPHPIAGIIVALALFISSATTHVAPAAGIWLVPWEWAQDQLGFLPGPLTGYPPLGAHAAELAGIAVLAGAVALIVTAQRAPLRAGLAATGVLAVAVACLAGAVELRPIPTAELDHLVSDVADPGSVQHCTTSRHVQYCLYPGFGVQLPALEAPVDGVLARVPALPARPLTIAQVATINLSDATLTHGHSSQQLATWTAQLARPARLPANANPALTIDQYVGSWPAGGANLTAARFTVALAAAEWAVNLPPSGPRFCQPLNQAREAIAIWLAIQATQASPAQVQGGRYFLGSAPGPAGGPGPWPVSQLAPVMSTTGDLLGEAMTRLPQAKVEHVIRASWSTWLNWHTTEAQLAAALGIQVPRAPAHHHHVTTSGGRQPPPAMQVCTG
jgi:hypothetical protein